MKKKLTTTGKLVFTVLALGICTAGACAVRSHIAKDDSPTTISATPSPEPTPTPETKTYHANMLLCGDSLIHGAIYYTASLGEPAGTFNFNKIMDDVAPIAHNYDIAYYNQETILGGTELVLSHYPCFNSPKEFGQYMIDSGFNLVALATNHTLDKGLDGIYSAMDFWNSHPEVHTSGVYLSPEEQQDIPVYEINGITYSIINWTYGCNGLQLPEGYEYMVNIYGDGYTYPDRKQEFYDQVKAAKEKADVVIAAPHWGTEYQNYPNDEQLEMAQALADAGADIIIGNHVHTIQPIQWLNDGKTICFYAMGNFVSAQIDPEQMTGLMGAIDITKTVCGDKTEIKIENPRADLIFTWQVPSHDNYHVYRYCDLDDTLLPDHEGWYNKWVDEVIHGMDDSIQVGGIW